MTTNVVVATYHAVVLGCDSLSSIVERAYFPLRNPKALAVGPDGAPLRDEEGRLLLPLDDTHFEYTPTNSMGGVQKMFLLHEDADPENIECSVAAITSGLGTLNGVVIAELAERFRRNARHRLVNYRTALDVASEFLSYIRPLWESQVQYDPEQPEKVRLYDDLQFLIAGYGPDDDHSPVLRVSVAQNNIQEQFPDAPHCSAAWAGQANSIASLVLGYSPSTRWAVERDFIEALGEQRETFTTSILQQLMDRGVNVPDPFEARIGEADPPPLSWSSGSPLFDWANLPVQSAVDLVSTLVNAESAIQKFAMGIPTVGGRTRIGLLRRGMPFAFLNEPQIIHQHVGYNHDS